jgi:hypothetical protein
MAFGLRKDTAFIEAGYSSWAAQWFTSFWCHSDLRLLGGAADHRFGEMGGGLLLLGGAALQRCDNRRVLNAALAAEEGSP